MSATQETAFDIKVKLNMLDYFRYYFSLFNLKFSGLAITVISAIIIFLYFLSLVSHIYIASTTGVFDWAAGKGILLNLVIIVLFTTPFSRTYLIAYKDAKTHKFLNKELAITITEGKFIVYLDGSKLEYPWKKMYKIFDFYHGFALFIDKKDLAFVIPKRFFKNKDQIKYVKEIIAKNSR